MPFVGTRGMIIPKHLFEAVQGRQVARCAEQPEAGRHRPYKFADFTPGDMVKGAINTDYHMPNRPFFDAIEMKGGGDAVSAARAVLQTGEFDYAWNLQVEDEVLVQDGTGRQGPRQRDPRRRRRVHPGGDADPWTEVDGERANPKTRHPILSAMRRCARRSRCCRQGRRSSSTSTAAPAIATSNFVNNPARFRSPEQQGRVQRRQGQRILEKAGWKKGADGIREKGGKKLKFVYQTSVNQPRQKTQQIIKQAARRPGSTSSSRPSPRRCSSRRTSAIRTRTRSSGPTSRCTPRR
jgi:peptide/nickel transport system substrate-binding protein